MDFSVNKEQRLEKALAGYGVKNEDLQDSIQTIKSWFTTQKHLPETPNDNTIMNFLFMTNFSIENTKKRLDMYYTIRNLIPEMFKDKNPKLPHMKRVAETVYCIPLPKVTEEGYRITVLRNNDLAPEEFDPYNIIGHINNVLEIRMHEDVTMGDIHIYDFSNAKMGHVVKLTPIFLKKCAVAFEEVFSNKIKQMHYINVPSFAESIISLAKSFLKPKLQERVIEPINTT
ncbi:unnamed protein product [Acanthoscelides obtectus]|uniref:CRAL-TRIO domain-containing protein n=1 Tax=Acanthoscelides obtectus TaxID=200917 RepID=A0A9P0LW61_ACAOB|nr:unnamed protein product [Acanthoscelides obtectus]CAK1659652.1 Alpha-tocopherol transfer protein [Acanthoscelides obtectus]